MGARVCSWLVLFAVLATAAYWSWLLAEQAVDRGQPALVSAAPSWPAAGGDWRNLFGAAAPEVQHSEPMPRAAPMRLIGVVAPHQGTLAGVALIAVGDQPARAYRIGADVDAGWFVQAVRRDGVELRARAGGTSAVRTLELKQQPLDPQALVAVRLQSSFAALEGTTSGVEGASPIVPPHPEMPTPSVADSRTPELRRARDAAEPLPAGAAVGRSAPTP